MAYENSYQEELLYSSTIREILFVMELNVIVALESSNLESLSSKIQLAGLSAIVTDDPQLVSQADRIILPGIGNYSRAMKHLRLNRMDQMLTKKAMEQNTPILGICLGMQLFFEESEEGPERGLAWLKGKVQRFPRTQIVPHVGWQSLDFLADSEFISESNREKQFYFSHSYYVNPSDESIIIAKATYGIAFPTILQKSNLLGLQFHPEKSHEYGFGIVKGFLRTPLC